MRWAATALLVLAAGGLLSACGGGEDGGGDPPALRPRASAGADEREARDGEPRAREGRRRRRGGGSPRRDAAPARPDGREPSPPRDGAPPRGEEAEVQPLEPSHRRDLAAARAAVAEFVARANRRDPSLCTELVTPAYLRQVTGRTGAAAVRTCRRDIAGARGSRVRVHEGTRVEGDTALVQFTSSLGEFAKRQILRLRRVRGRWLVDGAPEPRQRR